MKRAPLSDAEVARRLPVWTALSDLFLDTGSELTVPYIARTIVEAGVDADEAEEWLRWDVRPAFYPNLLSVAGEWAGWTEAFVRERVLERRDRWTNRLLGRNAFMPLSEWAAIRGEVARLRQARASSAAAVSSIQPPPSTRSPA